MDVVNLLDARTVRATGSATAAAGSRSHAQRDVVGADRAACSWLTQAQVAELFQWATARLSEYLVKGFTTDDERLKNPHGPGHRDYFDELLDRIREIRASERRFYQKVLDIYATSVDYRPDSELSQRFFATVQNKIHWATYVSGAGVIALSALEV